MRTRPSTRNGLRANAWLEILIALTLILGLLWCLVALYRSGAALVGGAARYGASRGQLAELALRWQREAASAWALFTPAQDVLGLPDCAGTTCREVDFFSRDPAGTAHFWAWRFDPAAQTLQRYTYADASDPGATLAASGPPLHGITAFSARRVLASALLIPALHGYVAKDVRLNLGYPGVDGGNALTALDVANSAERLLREYLPAATPSGFDIVVGTFSPPPSQPFTRDARAPQSLR